VKDLLSELNATQRGSQPSSTPAALSSPQTWRHLALLMPPDQTLLQRQLWKKAFRRHAKVSDEIAARTPACLHVSLIHYLTPELDPVVSMQDWQEKSGSGQEGQQRSFLQLSPG